MIEQLAHTRFFFPHADSDSWLTSDPPMQRKRKGAPEDPKKEAPPAKGGLRTATRSLGGDSDDEDEGGVVVVAGAKKPAPKEVQLNCPHVKNISFTKTSKTLFNPGSWLCAGALFITTALRCLSYRVKIAEPPRVAGCASSAGAWVVADTSTRTPRSTQKSRGIAWPLRCNLSIATGAFPRFAR